MKVTIENKNGLETNIKILIDKKIISEQLDNKFEEIKKDVVLKGFRPGKVPTEILKRQFGKAVYGEVIDKVLKESSTKALEDNKIKPAGQPKIDLKSFGEGKDLEYVISVTELPKIDLKLFNNITYDEYVVKIDPKETENRIEQIAKTQNNFKEADESYCSKEGDLIVFDYEATVTEKPFKGNIGKNTQLVLGKDLFIRGFDKQLLNSKKNENKIVEVKLPENFPEKEVANKMAKFNCKITTVKKPEKVSINDNFAKNLGAKDLKDLKSLVSKQIDDEYKNSLEIISKQKILDQIEKFKIADLPKNLIEQEKKLISQGMKDEDIKKNNKSLEEEAKKRIKTGLFLSAFGEEKQIKVNEQEMNNELSKQMGMMPGQEKLIQDYYQKNPAALNTLRGNIYEGKIIDEIKKIGKSIKKEITKEQAEKILKDENEKKFKKQSNFASNNDDQDILQEKEKREDDKDKKMTKSKKLQGKKTKILIKKKKTTKKVSKK